MALAYHPNNQEVEAGKKKNKRPKGKAYHKNCSMGFTKTKQSGGDNFPHFSVGGDSVSLLALTHELFQNKGQTRRGVPEK